MWGMENGTGGRYLPEWWRKLTVWRSLTRGLSLTDSSERRKNNMRMLKVLSCCDTGAESVAVY